MNYLILSDIHGAKENLKNLLNTYDGKIQGIFFAGDGLDSFKEIKLKVPLYSVKGNMDHIQYNTFEIIKIEKFTIAITHGHLFDVKKDLKSLKNKVLSENFDLVIYGHTHIQHYEKVLNTVFINPGAFQNGSFAILTVENNDFYISFEELI